MPTAANLHYFTSGSSDYDRPPVLLIHGAGGHHLYWPPQIRRISNHRIFAMDLPGHGQSDGIGRDRIEDYVDDVVAFMSSCRDSIRPSGLGTQWAVPLPCRRPSTDPAEFWPLALVGCGARMRVDPTLLSLTSREAAFPVALKLIGERSFSEATDPRLKEPALQRMAEMRSTVLHGDLVACNAFDEISRLGEIRVPTLILCGAEDRMTPLTQLSSCFTRGYRVRSCW